MGVDRRTIPLLILSISGGYSCVPRYLDIFPSYKEETPYIPPPIIFLQIHDVYRQEDRSIDRSVQHPETVCNLTEHPVHRNIIS